MTSHYLTEEASTKRIEAPVDRLVDSLVNSMIDRLVDRFVSEAVPLWPQSSDYHRIPDDLRSIVRSRAKARLRASVHQESHE